ncbi:MAG: hypothetical protein V4488_03045 [Pseudomonadota bacterium]
MNQPASNSVHSAGITTTAGSTIPAGIAIAAATILSILFVALDDSATGASPLAILQSMIAMTAMKQVVHGVAIASVLAYAFGYSSLAVKLDVRRPLVLAGLTTYLIGCVAMIGATMLDGFISSDVASQFAGASPEGVKLGYNLVVFMGIALTDLAKLGWILQAVAAIAWSISLLAERGFSRFSHVIGWIGLASGGLVIVVVVSAGANMSMAALLGTLAAQAIWNLAAAALLIRDKGINTWMESGSLQHAA